MYRGIGNVGGVKGSMSRKDEKRKRAISALQKI